MRLYPRPLVIATIWVATVAGASTLTWGVISSAGTTVGQLSTIATGTMPTHLPSASTTPTTKPTTKPTLSPIPSSPSKPTSPSSPTAPTVVDTWNGRAGKVTASCTAQQVSLVSAVPSVGYRVQASKDGTRRLEVEFERVSDREDDEGDEVHLLVDCAQGYPEFHSH